MDNFDSIIKEVFPTPLYRVRIDDVDSVQRELEVVYNDLTEKGKFQYIKGWKYMHQISDSSFHTNLFEQYVLPTLYRELCNHVQLYLQMIGSPVAKQPIKIMSSWMTKMGEGDFAPTHSHGHADISGVYYFKAQPTDGALYFNEPNTHTKSSYCFGHLPNRVAYKPEVGSMMLFPGWIEHGVLPSQQNNERLSVAFNICFDRQFG